MGIFHTFYPYLPTGRLEKGTADASLLIRFANSLTLRPASLRPVRTKSIPCVKSRLVRTGQGKAQCRTHERPWCAPNQPRANGDVPRRHIVPRADGQTGRRRSARTSSAPQSAQTATGPLHHRVSATVSPNRSQPKQRSVQTEVSPNRRHPKMARMSSTICSSIRRLSERSC